MSRMPNRTLLALPVLLLASTARSAASQSAPPQSAPPLQLRWELVGDSLTNDGGSSRVLFTLTNRDTKPLPKSGWAIYFSALHSAQPGSAGAGCDIQDVMADLHRIVPGPAFAGLAPGASMKIPYVTDLLSNGSSAPSGPYIVFDSAKDVGVPLSDYVAVPFERSVGVVTPEIQYARDSGVRDIAVSDLPPVFPTPVQVTRRAGEVRLTAMPAITAPAELTSEAQFAAEYLRPYVGSGKGSVALRLEVGPVEGQSSPEAYELVIDPTTGVRIVGVSGLCWCRHRKVRGWSCQRCASWTRPDSATAVSCSTSHATSIRRPRCCARST